jgi:hypothetical protein
MGGAPASSRRSARCALGLAVLVALLAAPAAASATNVSDFTVIPATGGTALPLTGGVRTIAGPAIDVAMYSNPDVFPAGLTIGLTLPDGFAFDPTVVTAPTVAIAAGMPAGFCTLTTSSLAYGAGKAPRRVTFGLAGTHDVGCTVTLSDLRVHWVGGSSSTRNGRIAVDWTIPGVGSGHADGGRLAAVDLGGRGDLPPTDTTDPSTDGAPLGALAGLVAALCAVIMLAARGRSRLTAA